MTRWWVKLSEDMVLIGVRRNLCLALLFLFSPCLSKEELSPPAFKNYFHFILLFDQAIEIY